MQDITACVCLGEGEGWKTVKKKANVCCFSPACRTALAAPVMSASLCVPDKTQHRCDDVIRKVAEDFLFVCFFYSQGDAIQQGASCTRREPRRAFTQLQCYKPVD